MKKKAKINFSELWNQIDFKKFSTLSLIFSNLIVIVFAVVDNLSAVDILWIYWTQSVIIGIFNFIKILSLKEFSTEGFRQGGKQVQPTKATKISTAIFFLFHYGFFHVIYAIFIGSFSTFGRLSNTANDTNYILYASLTFFVCYFIEFINSKNEPNDTLPNLGYLMFAPYARIIPMHLTIILGGFIGAAGGFFSADTNLAIIILFTTIKTIVDLISHSVDFKSTIKQKVTVAE